MNLKAIGLCVLATLLVGCGSDQAASEPVRTPVFGPRPAPDRIADSFPAAADTCDDDVCKPALTTTPLPPLPDPLVYVGQGHCSKCNPPAPAPPTDQNAWRTEPAATGVVQMKALYQRPWKAPPDGFVILRESICLHMPPETRKNGWLLQKVSELPVTTMTVCEESPIPTGWYEVEKTYTQDCEDKGTHRDPETGQQVSNNNAKKIRKIE
ncbi:MAG TPA: hypothetical protein PKE29_13570 [Phycisphaerales bacterium]|nr:hypothetical protein [Phycisphaerales bacterium]